MHCRRRCMQVSRGMHNVSSCVACVHVCDPKLAPCEWYHLKEIKETLHTVGTAMYHTLTTDSAALSWRHNGRKFRSAHEDWLVASITN